MYHGGYSLYIRFCRYKSGASLIVSKDRLPTLNTALMSMALAPLVNDKFASVFVRATKPEAQSCWGI